MVQNRWPTLNRPMRLVLARAVRAVRTGLVCRGSPGGRWGRWISAARLPQVAGRTIGWEYAAVSQGLGSTGTQRPNLSHRWLGSFLRDFPWIHLLIGLAGNLLFFVGSIMFFSKQLETGAIWLFVLGSLGMLIGSLGEIFVRIEKRRTGSD